MAMLQLVYVHVQYVHLNDDKLNWNVYAHVWALDQIILFNFFKLENLIKFPVCFQ